mmetsp:Transcript_44649/g.124497  ORF Transcript_44649/g.124497 Transcript_44649/m.124497 type:complete len:248 (-) Transcript_44649:915-1658(-)
MLRWPCGVHASSGGRVVRRLPIPDGTAVRRLPVPDGKGALDLDPPAAARAHGGFAGFPVPQRDVHARGHPLPHNCNLGVFMESKLVEGRRRRQRGGRRRLVGAVRVRLRPRGRQAARRHHRRRLWGHEGRQGAQAWLPRHGRRLQELFSIWAGRPALVCSARAFRQYLFPAEADLGGRHELQVRVGRGAVHTQRNPVHRRDPPPGVLRRRREALARGQRHCVAGQEVPYTFGRRVRLLHHRRGVFVQ